MEPPPMGCCPFPPLWPLEWVVITILGLPFTISTMSSSPWDGQGPTPSIQMAGQEPVNSPPFTCTSSGWPPHLGRQGGSHLNVAPILHARVRGGRPDASGLHLAWVVWCMVSEVSCAIFFLSVYYWTPPDFLSVYHSSFVCLLKVSSSCGWTWAFSCSDQGYPIPKNVRGGVQ